jgi:hypothetical protein
MLGDVESNRVSLMGAFINSWSLVGSVEGDRSAMMDSMKAVTTSEEEVEWSEDIVVERCQMMRGSASFCSPFMLLRASASWGFLS